MQCIDYINRAVELTAKIRNHEKKKEYLSEVYDDVLRLKGEDSSFLSISLIELLISQDYSCDFNDLIPIADKLIDKGSIRNPNVVEQAYQVKAKLYKKLKNVESENEVYIQYADSLMAEVEKLIKESDAVNIDDNRNWFMAENNAKKAIGLFQNHGAVAKNATTTKNKSIKNRLQELKEKSKEKFK